MCMAVSGRHFGHSPLRRSVLRIERRKDLRPLCPPSSSIGWGQGCAPPPHYLSAGAMMRGKHISPAPPLCLPSGNPIVHLTSIVVCGGLRPPRPRSCGSCVPLRSWPRPRGYPLRNVGPALSHLVSHHPPIPHPLSPFPPRTPRGGTTIGWDIFCRLAHTTAGPVCVLGSRYSGACGSSRAPTMVLPRIYGYRGLYLVIIRILDGSVIVRWWSFFGCRIENPTLNYDK